MPQVIIRARLRQTGLSVAYDAGGGTLASFWKGSTTCKFDTLCAFHIS
jgi:hypothetical protein